jgi:hypothetical protein
MNDVGILRGKTRSFLTVTTFTWTRVRLNEA